MSAARPDGSNAKRKWARERTSGIGVREAGGLGPGGGVVLGPRALAQAWEIQ